MHIILFYHHIYHSYHCCLGIFHLFSHTWHFTNCSLIPPSVVFTWSLSLFFFLDLGSLGLDTCCALERRPSETLMGKDKKGKDEERTSCSTKFAHSKNGVFCCKTSKTERTSSVCINTPKRYTGKSRQGRILEWTCIGQASRFDMCCT